MGITGLILIPSLFFGTSYLIEQSFACKLTPANPGGPYYIPDAPFKDVMGPDLPGERFYLKGRVINQDCDPISDATLDFWQTDSEGKYDSEGYILRGKFKTDEEGIFFLDTIFPATYSESGLTRPRHIHVKVWIPEQDTLTTQLYFSGEQNLDLFVRDELVMKITELDGVKSANFDFVIFIKNL